MVGGGALATTVLADRSVMWDVPDHWTLEQASTVPRVYSVVGFIYKTIIINILSLNRLMKNARRNIFPYGGVRYGLFMLETNGFKKLFLAERISILGIFYM